MRTAVCPRCQTRSFVEEATAGGYVTACCDERIVTAGEEPARVASIASHRRRKPSEFFRRKVMRLQHDRCFWCGRVFGSLVVIRGEPTPLRCVMDHYIPRALGLENQQDDDFVASCHVCNGFKSSRILADEESMRDWIRSRWEAKGIREAA